MEEVDSSANAIFLEKGKFNMFEFGGMPPLLSMFFLFQMGNDLVNSCLSYKGVQDFLKEDQKFDVCVIELFNADAMVVSKYAKQQKMQILHNLWYKFQGIAEKYGCVVISYTTFGAVKWINDMTSK
jgi:hypothetical protein